MTLRWKILLAVLLGMLVSYVYTFGDHTWSARKLNPNYKPTVGKLWTEYRYINQKAFYGSLPEDKTTIYLSDLSDEDEMGEIIESDRRFTIRIDILSHPLEKEAEITLIHEACHQSVKLSNGNEGLDGHSGDFQACMIHVASVGGFNDLW